MSAPAGYWRGLPSLPKDRDGPVFKAPWEAQAFAMAVELYEEGHVTWVEWAEALGAQIAAAKARGDEDLGDSYYLHWLAALEGLVVAKGIVSSARLARRRHAWARAVERTPHGEAILLAEDET